MKYANNKSKNGLGFTLLEIMFVLVIIGVIFVLIVRVSQERASQMLIQKSGQQMQSLFQAAIDYYLKNYQWPGTDKPKQAGQELKTAGFIPDITGIGDPLAGAYGGFYDLCPSNTATGCPSSTVAPAPNVVFRIGYDMPASLPAAQAEAIAAQIAALLPNGQVRTGGDCPSGSAPNACVVAEINIPGQEVDRSSYVKYTYIVPGDPYNCKIFHDPSGGSWPPSASDMNPVEQIPFPSCPAGYIPQIFASPATLSANVTTDGNNTTFSTLSGLYILPLKNLNTNNGWNIYIFNLSAPIQQLNATGGESVQYLQPVCEGYGNSGNTLAMVITKCCDPSDPKNSCYQQKP